MTYSRHRKAADRFAAGRTVIAYRNQQRLLFSALAAAFAATAVARRATDLCWRIPPPPDPANDRSVSILRTAGLIKATVDRLAERATSQCRKACGSLGFLSLSRLVDYQGLAVAFNTAGGDNHMLLLEAAWSMATGGDYEPPPLYPPDRLAPWPPQPDSWVKLLNAREHLLHRKLTRHLAEAADSGVDQFAAWNERTDLALRLAEAHAASLTMAATLDACAAFPPDLAAAGRDLCLMVFLEEISANASWYLTEGLLTAHVVRTLPDQLTAVCARLLPYAQRLTDMLNVPTTIIRSAIVDADYATKLAPAPGDGQAKLSPATWARPDPLQHAAWR